MSDSVHPDRPSDSVVSAAPTMAQAIRDAIRAVSETTLSDQQAEAAVIAVYEWCRDYHHVDLLEFRG